jgi:predicted small secreted protein
MPKKGIMEYMKLRWWIVGTIAAVTSGVLVMKYITDNKQKLFHFADSDNEKNYDKSQDYVHESEFDGTNFLT